MILCIVAAEEGVTMDHSYQGEVPLQQHFVMEATGAAAAAATGAEKAVIVVYATEDGSGSS